MNKKGWTVTPFFIILAVLCLAMSGVSFFYDKTVFYIELPISLAAVAGVLFSVFKFKGYISTVVKKASSSFSGFSQSAIDQLSVSAAVVDDNGIILMSNRSFNEKLCDGISKLGENAAQFLPSEDINDFFRYDGVDIKSGGNWFVAMGVLLDKGAVIYFIDNNEVKSNSEEYILSRPIVANVAFDNKEEFERDGQENISDQMSITVESKLQEWAAQMNGFYKKLDKESRYLIVFEERYLRQITEQKFKILENVRAIKINDVSGATISIGVSRGAKTFREAELWARQALNMALGRGGDQAAVKKGDSYEFFGGTSKGVENRSKVRTRVIAATLTEHIKSSDNVLVMGHRFSDLDSVGSAVGMWSAVSKGMGISAHIVINKQQSLAKPIITSIEKVNGDDVFIDEEAALALATDKTLLIIVDTHSPGFVESVKVYERCKRIVVIDHHRMMVNHIENALVFYHEPYASSASEMTAELMQYMGNDALNRLESEALLAGIMLDTKNFVLRTGVRTFEAAAYLRGVGADTVEVKRLFSNSIDTYKVKYKLVSEAEIFNSCAIACADEILPDIRIASAQAADELLGIENVKASFVMFPTDGIINISARSLGDINVQVLMEQLGGGGHQTMAACQLKDTTIEEARERLVNIVNTINREEALSQPDEQPSDE